MKLLRVLSKLLLVALMVVGWLAALVSMFVALFTHGDVWGPLAVVFIGYFGVQILYMLNVFANLPPTQTKGNPLLRRVE